jgi:hypothetical protein
MGPKKGDGGGKKAAQKQVNKTIDDKTFGLKNKNKSTVVKAYVKGVENQARGKTGNQQALESQTFEERALKKKLKEEEAFLNSLSQTVKTIKHTEVEDEDEKRNTLCQFFAQTGFCEEGDSCYFSHDLNIEFNQGTFDIYTDLRNTKSKLGFDFAMMEDKENKRSKQPKTDIVCKHFLAAIKSKIYGWKWNCANGDECIYKHCLPKDYVLKSMQKSVQEEMTFEEFYDLENKIDEERARITTGGAGTKVTTETLAAWLEKRKLENERSQDPKKKEKELLSKMKTGRELFNANKDKDEYKDDDNADNDVYVKDEDEDENENNCEDLTKNTNEVDNVDTDLFKDEGDLDDIEFNDEEDNQ